MYQYVRTSVPINAIVYHNVYVPVPPNIHWSPARVVQLNMEEQMIFGALQTLSEEACEDVLQQQEQSNLHPTSLTYNASTGTLRQ